MAIVTLWGMVLKSIAIRREWRVEMKMPERTSITSYLSLIGYLRLIRMLLESSLQASLAVSQLLGEPPSPSSLRYKLVFRWRKSELRPSDHPFDKSDLETVQARTSCVSASRLPFPNQYGRLNLPTPQYS